MPYPLYGTSGKKLLFFVCVLCIIVQQTSAQTWKNEILWDRYGIPHVYARSTSEMYYEFGWAQMHNHANLILKLYGQARGRAAEYWGENYLASDKQIQLFRVPMLAEKEYAGQNNAFRGFLDSFVKGVNDYANAHPEAISPENKQVLPVTGTDVIAHGIRVIFLRFVAAENLGLASRSSKAGSNSLAIGPSRSSTGNAMLLANPHLPWADLFIFFEAHLQAPGFNAYGAAVVGLPVLNIAFNDHLGWTHTVNPIDACDRYELSVQGDRYLLDSTLIPFEKRSVTLKVRQKDGQLVEQSVEFNYSRHGPVLNIKGEKVYAIRIAGMENPAIFYQWHQMAKATNWKEFEAALKMMQLPMFNVIYADDRGNISYLFDGNVPRRVEGDWKFWNGVVDGRYSKYIWQETLSYEELPKLFDPATGFIQNANDPPWTCTYPTLLDPHKFPGYIAPQGMQLRPQRAVNMIKNESGVTFEKLIGFKLNTGMEAADRFLAELLADVKEYPDSMALRAASVLKGWDKTTDADSRGGVLFARWVDKLNNDMFSQPWDSARPVETPAGLKNPKMAVALLAEAAGEVLKEYDSLNVAWGDIYRLRIDKSDFPANGGPEKYGIYRTLYFIRDSDKKYHAIAGDSYVAVIEFGKKIKARVLLSYGNATQPKSSHIGDQLLLLSRKELRTAWLLKKEILQNLEQTEQF
ncbi:MAG TPA: acylase [Puia sp.]|nr:acylase [Puia sp.]